MFPASTGAFALKHEDACRHARGTNAHYTTLFIAFYNPVARIGGAEGGGRECNVEISAEPEELGTNKCAGGAGKGTQTLPLEI